MKLECVKRKQEFLLVLHSAFENFAPAVYERAAIIVSEFIDASWMVANELKALNLNRKIVRCLMPKRPTE